MPEIPINGLDEVVVVETAVHPGNRSNSQRQSLRYKNLLGDRMTVDIRSEINCGGVTYRSAPAGDTISAGRRWRHLGETRVGSADWAPKVRPHEAELQIGSTTPPTPTMKLRVSCSPEAPFSEIYEGELDLPF